MAEDENPDEAPPEEPEEEALEEADLDEAELDEDELELEDDIPVADDVEDVLEDDDEEDDEDDEAAARKRPKGEEEDDDEEVDPDDVEADLDTILKDRIAAGDDEDQDEDEEDTPVAAPAEEGPEGVTGRQEGEVHCPNCFLLVPSAAVAATGECPHCGEPM